MRANLVDQGIFGMRRQSVLQISLQDLARVLLHISLSFLANQAGAKTSVSLCVTKRQSPVRRDASSQQETNLLQTAQSLVSQAIKIWKQSQAAEVPAL